MNNTLRILLTFVITTFVVATITNNLYHKETVYFNAGVSLPQAVAVFETSLQAPITSSATSMTLTSNSIRGGGSLSGYNCFTVDEGNTNAETICGTVSGTSVTSLTRGVSQSTGTTTVATLQFSHRRGANVKITDFPIIQILKAQNNGEDTFDNILSYTTHPTFTLSTQIIDKGYADGLAFAGVATSTESNFGGVWLATQQQMASSTDGLPNAPYVLQSKYATSTPDGTSQAGLYIPISLNNGKLHQLWLDLTEDFTFTTGTSTFNGGLAINTVDYYFPSTITASSTTLRSSATGDLYWGFPVATSTVFTSSGTWTRPAGVEKVRVRVVGGGGGGGGTDSGDASDAGGGGGAGGYAEAVVSVSGNVTVTVGAAGAGVSSEAGGNGGNSSFAGDVTVTANGGTGGSQAGASSVASGGAGGSTTNADLGITGQSGDRGLNSEKGSGGGGSNPLGFGAQGVFANGAGGTGTGYGAGGSGAQGNNQDLAGGNGTAGVVIVEWYE